MKPVTFKPGRPSEFPKLADLMQDEYDLVYGNSMEQHTIQVMVPASLAMHNKKLGLLTHRKLLPRYPDQETDEWLIAEYQTRRGWWVLFLCETDPDLL